MTVYCNVIDLNDNAPVFEPGPHAAEVLENATIGTSVLSVAAQDLDSGDNGKIVYAIAGGDENGDFGVAVNGTVFTRKMLDRETRPLYNLVLSATDSPKPPYRPLSSTVQVSERELKLKKIYIYMYYLAFRHFAMFRRICEAETAPFNIVQLAKRHKAACQT